MLLITFWSISHLLLEHRKYWFARIAPQNTRIQCLLETFDTWVIFLAQE